MMKVMPDFAETNVVGRIGSQPIAIAAAALIVIVAGVGIAFLWRAYTGISPEQDRAARLLQARTTQATEQLIDRTKGLETTTKGLEITQQEAVDQLQIVQDQLQTVKRLLAAQQADTKRLSEQVESLTGAIDTLRQSFASTQSSEASHPHPDGKTSVRSRSGEGKGGHRKHAKSHG